MRRGCGLCRRAGAAAGQVRAPDSAAGVPLPHNRLDRRTVLLAPVHRDDSATGVPLARTGLPLTRTRQPVPNHSARRPVRGRTPQAGKTNSGPSRRSRFVPPLALVARSV